MRYLLIIAALLCGTALAFAADPVGAYRVIGTNPGGGSRYHGSVKVERTGKTYRVVWVVGGTRYIGTEVWKRR